MRPQAGLVTIQFMGGTQTDAANYPEIFLALSTSALAKKMLTLFPPGCQIVDTTGQQDYTATFGFSAAAIAMGIRSWDIQGTDPAGIAFDCSVGEMAFRLQHPLASFGDTVGIPVKPHQIGTPAAVGLSIGFMDEPQFGMSFAIWKYTPPPQAPPTLQQLQAEIAQLQKVQTPGMPF